MLYINNHLVDTNKDIVTGKIEVKKGTKSISDFAFYACENMTDIIIPDGVVSIGHGAFWGCYSLNEIFVPDSVVFLEASFKDTAYYKNEKKWENGVLYIGNHIINAKKELIPENYIIKQGTKTIHEDAFSGCTKLKKIVIPDSVIEISPNTFYNTKSEAYEVFNLPKVDIFGYNGSVAQSYANGYGISFTDISIAIPTNAKVIINGKEISFTAYNIGGNNHFKLRDLAMAINGTKKNFNVAWDQENNAVSLLSNQEYTVVGGELAVDSSAKVTTPSVTDSKVYVDGKLTSFMAFNIENNNYFKLRDIGKCFNFGIGWDDVTKTITIDTSTEYTE